MNIQHQELENLEGLRKINKKKLRRSDGKPMIPLSISLSGDVSEEGGGFCLSVSSADKATAEAVFKQWYKRLKHDSSDTKKQRVGGYQ